MPTGNTVKAKASGSLAEIFQTSGMKFSFLSEDGTEQAVPPCKCRDFLSDALWVHWGKIGEANIYGFKYSGTPKLDPTVLTVQDVTEDAVKYACVLLKLEYEKVDIGGKEAFLVRIGRETTTFGISAITLVIRCCEKAVSQPETMEDLKKLADEQEKGTQAYNKTTSTYIGGLVKEGRDIKWILDVIKDKNMLKLHKGKDLNPSMSVVHNNGGIVSLSSGKNGMVP